MEDKSKIFDDLKQLVEQSKYPSFGYPPIPFSYNQQNWEIIANGILHPNSSGLFCTDIANSNKQLSNNSYFKQIRSRYKRNSNNTNTNDCLSLKNTAINSRKSGSFYSHRSGAHLMLQNSLTEQICKSFQKKPSQESSQMGCPPIRKKTLQFWDDSNDKSPEGVKTVRVLDIEISDDEHDKSFADSGSEKANELGHEDSPIKNKHKHRRKTKHRPRLPRFTRTGTFNKSNISVDTNSKSPKHTTKNCSQYHPITTNNKSSNDVSSFNHQTTSSFFSGMDSPKRALHNYYNSKNSPTHSHNNTANTQQHFLLSRTRYLDRKFDLFKQKEENSLLRKTIEEYPNFGQPLKSKFNNLNQTIYQLSNGQSNFKTERKAQRNDYNIGKDLDIEISFPTNGNHIFSRNGSVSKGRNNNFGNKYISQTINPLFHQPESPKKRKNNFHSLHIQNSRRHYINMCYLGTKPSLKKNSCTLSMDSNQLHRLHMNK